MRRIETVILSTYGIGTSHNDSSLTTAKGTYLRIAKLSNILLGNAGNFKNEKLPNCEQLVANEECGPVPRVVLAAGIWHISQEMSGFLIPMTSSAERRRCAGGIGGLVGILAIFLTAHATAGDVQTGAAQLSFDRDVMPVMSKAGCNMGACHGNRNGKGGFKLSLRGESPLLDYEQIVKGDSSRRVQADAPEASYLLRKPTQQVGHEGGKRFEIGSPEYEVLRQWIAQGAPPEPENAPKLTALDVSPAERVLVAPDSQLKLQVTATFSDGQQRDVSRWAVYEPFSLHASVTQDGLVERVAFGEVTIAVRYLHLQKPVRLAFVEGRPDWQWSAPEPANFVDEHVFAKLRTLRMNPSEPCSDSEFLRRAWLDIAGRLPGSDEALAFVQNPDPQKRAKLIDHLLEQPEFADYWALKWADILRIEEKVLDRRGVETFHGWIRDSIVKGMPMDEFARQILTATGSTYSNPPANYYRALRNPAARAEAAAQVFLGTRLQCARCHNHPYEKWTQDQYYELAAAFDGIDYTIVSNDRKDGLDKHQFNGEQIVFLTAQREQKHPNTNQFPLPTFLGVQPARTALAERYAPANSGALDRFSANQAFFQSLRTPEPERDQLQQLAQWMTAPDNKLFARTQVNRIWYHLMGQGIIDPVDDLRATNPPVNPALLDALVSEFVSNGYDLKATIRTITTSQTYGLSSAPNDSNNGDSTNFSHATITRLTAEQLLDGIHQVAGVPLELKDEEKGKRAVQIAGVASVAGRELKPGTCEQFLKVFGKPERLLSSDLERTNATSLAQILELTSGRSIDRVLREQDNVIGRQLNQDTPVDQIIDDFFWRTLSRPPSSGEASALTEYVLAQENRRSALEDVVWSLINSKAFLLRH
jgi:mono/diheme cytochrome c family protein